MIRHRPDHPDGADDAFLPVAEGGDDHRQAGGVEQPALGADEDLHALAALGELEQPQHRLLRLQPFEQRLDLVHPGHLVEVLQQLGLAADDQAAGAAAGPGRQPGLDHLVGQGVERGAVGGDLLVHPGPGIFQAAAGEAGIQVVAGLRERGGRQAGRDLDHPVLDLAVLRHQHHQGAAGAEGDEFQVADAPLALRRHHQPGGAGQAREHLPGLGQGLLQRAAGGGAAGRDRLPLALAEVAEFQQPVDEQPQAAIGRQPAGGGMRGIEEAGLLEIRHDVADRGRGEAERQAARQGAGAHRLAGQDIDLDQFAEDGRAAAVEAREGSPGRAAERFR